MGSASLLVLPSYMQRRGEIIGIICGALCFPFGFFGESLGRLFPGGPAGIILPIVLFSAFAGIIACLFGTEKAAEKMAGFALSVGVPAGLVATLIGGALTILAASFHSLGIGSPNPNLISFWRLPCWEYRPRSFSNGRCAHYRDGSDTAGSFRGRTAVATPKFDGFVYEEN